MKYLLMFWDDESVDVGADAAAMKGVRAWVEEMTGRGIRLHGSSLRSARDASLVRVRDGELLVSDGPFAETKDQIGGYDVVECADLDMAIRVAAAHPLARMNTVEVRPFAEFPWNR
jgi:hypothetical protein